jgi:hypothetical protein
VAEVCTGDSVRCPDDGFRDDGEACDDGNNCTAIDRCQGGACVGTGEACDIKRTFSQMMFTGQKAPNVQCTAWDTFRRSLNAFGTYNKITISGSAAVLPISCSGLTANLLCQALRAGTALFSPQFCNGNSWTVTTGCQGTGSVALEIVALGQPACSCANKTAVRPCATTAGAWGGVTGLSTTCGAASQRIDVTCE